jgi:hypothetical protein
MVTCLRNRLYDVCLNAFPNVSNIYSWFNHNLDAHNNHEGSNVQSLLVFFYIFSGSMCFPSYSNYPVRIRMLRNNGTVIFLWSSEPHEGLKHFQM